jgi:hypothetical protein
MPVALIGADAATHRLSVMGSSPEKLCHAAEALQARPSQSTVIKLKRVSTLRSS